MAYLRPLTIKGKAVELGPSSNYKCTGDDAIQSVSQLESEIRDWEEEFLHSVEPLLSP